MRFPEGWRDIFAAVRRIPRGRVATYGQVAVVAGRPGRSRLVGHVLGALPGTGEKVPWFRVMGQRGRGHAGISILDPMGAGVQRDLLEREGVEFDARARVDLGRFGWRHPALVALATPRRAPARGARSRRRTAGSSGRRRSDRSGRR
ncbi:MAG: MGMT family protein [Anaeromyxobacteraceae bacterium]